MKTLIKVIIGGLVCLSVLSCRSVKINNGRIPAEYLNQVKQIEGTYTGQMNYQSVSLNVELVGDYLKVTAIPDLLGTGCKSKIGDLTTVWVKGNAPNYQVTDATFKFNPNFCSANVQGNSVSFSIKKTGGTIKLNASILERMDSHQVCEPICTGPAGCFNQCHFEDRPVYLYGEFIRR